jgi:predicted Rossmann fold flavoprotein
VDGYQLQEIIRMNLASTSNMKNYDVVIVGAGAAGLFCAIQAGQRSRRVLVLEHNDKVGKKILISGGGRCNFTNLYAGPENFLSQNPRFCHSALARFSAQDFIALVEKHRIAYHEKKLGQLFCDDSARQITGMLLRECEGAGVEIRLNCSIQQVEKNDRFVLHTNQGILESQALVIASGGLSISKLGASDFGYQIARQFGLNIIEPRPALVPLTLSGQDLRRFSELSGVSVDALVKHQRAEFRENLLITHRGISGPAVLQISSYLQPGEVFTVNILPEQNIPQLLEREHRRDIEVQNWLSQWLPKRFARRWCELFTCLKPLKQFTPAELEQLAHHLQDWVITPAGTEGFRKAEVTLGGVDTRELSPKTMESRKVSGLYFVGEVVDVTGHLGGFNFQWAWSSGYAAGGVV